MEAPVLVLVPSSPITHSTSTTPSPALSAKDHSPVSSDSSHTSPPSSYGVSAGDDPARNSSESTIFSIYSMYSERRQTWNKLPPGTSAPVNASPTEHGSHHKKQSGEAVTADDRRTGSPYRSVSRQSSNGSQFFAGSADSTSQHTGYSPAHSRPASRARSAMLDVGSGVGSRPGVAVRPTSELPYLNSHSLPSYGASSSSTVQAADRFATPAAPTPTRGSQPVLIPRRANFVDLSMSTDDVSPKQRLRQYSGSPGRPHDLSRASTVTPDNARESTSRSSTHSHWKSDSTSTGGHVGLGLNGLETASTTHEGYVTAPQSIESSVTHSLPRATVLPPQRFRVTNPGLTPPQSPSPPPVPPVPPAITASPALPTPGGSRRSSVVSSNKALPPRPRTSPSQPPSAASVKRLSVASGPSPKRPVTSGGASSRGSVAQAEGEESEAYFVRNTYAFLDVTGVRGDGYEEGIERTRAKLGHDRRSVQLAAKKDAKEEVSGDIPEKELEILKNVDRYGFFTVPSHERLVLLPAASFAKPLHPVTHADRSYPPSPALLPRVPDEPTGPKVREKEMQRIAKWERMLVAERRDAGGNVAVWGVRAGKDRKFRTRVFKGIPDRWRAAAWEVLIGQWVAHRRSGPPFNSLELERMLERLKSDYRAGLDQPSSYDVQIDLDVPRTINGHVLFKTRYGQGQRALFHTLHSFSLVCEECGYCQGMGPLAATLLCYYDPEKVYAMLVHFHDEYQMHDIFLPGFPGLLEAIYIQERIIEKMLPNVFASFKKHMISTTSYATKWYITLFANSVPFRTQLRLWDAFFLEGRDVFIITAVAIVWVLRDHLTSNQANFETVLSLLSSFFVPEDEDALMRWIERALDDKKLRADIGRWRLEWRQLVAEKKDADALL